MASSCAICGTRGNGTVFCGNCGELFGNLDEELYAVPVGVVEKGGDGVDSHPKSLSFFKIMGCFGLSLLSAVLFGVALLTSEWSTFHGGDSTLGMTMSLEVSIGLWNLHCSCSYDYGTIGGVILDDTDPAVYVRLCRELNGRSVNAFCDYDLNPGTDKLCTGQMDVISALVMGALGLMALILLAIVLISRNQLPLYRAVAVAVCAAGVALIGCVAAALWIDIVSTYKGVCGKPSHKVDCHVAYGFSFLLLNLGWFSAVLAALALLWVGNADCEARWTHVPTPLILPGSGAISSPSGPTSSAIATRGSASISSAATALAIGDARDASEARRKEIDRRRREEKRRPRDGALSDDGVHEPLLSLEADTLDSVTLTGDQQVKEFILGHRCV